MGDGQIAKVGENATALLAIGAVAVGSWRAGKRFVIFVRDMLDAASTIQRELKPNGGSSIVDRLARIESHQVLERQLRRMQCSGCGLAFWESDDRGEWIYASETLCALVGCDAVEVLGNGWSTNLHHDDRDRVDHEWDIAVEQRRAFKIDCRFCHDDGNVVKVRATAWPIYNGDVLKGYVGTVMPLEVP